MTQSLTVNSRIMMDVMRILTLIFLRSFGKFADVGHYTFALSSCRHTNIRFLNDSSSCLLASICVLLDKIYHVVVNPFIVSLG